MNSFKPMLLTSLKSYDRAQFAKDVTAGIIVAIIALPLSIALALASGVGPEAGIFTAIVAGFVISALGGSCVQIAGCHDCCRYCRAGRPRGADDGDHSCRCLPYYHGLLSFWKSDQVYSLYDYNGFYFRYCGDNRDRTVKGFLRRYVS